MIEFLDINLTIFALVGVAAAHLLSRLVLKYALSTQLLDIPNSRSSHDTPTAQGGGIAIVCVVLCSSIYLSAIGSGSTRELTILLVAGVLVATTGFLDDRYSLPASIRIVIHMMSAAIVVFGIGAIPVATIAGSETLATAIAIAATGVALVWATNLYNFMDGIDGISCVQGIAISAIAVTVLEPDVSSAIPAMFLATGAGCLGFVFLNWSPARIFMGDVGSGFLGLMYGALLVWATVEFRMSIWTASIIPAVFVADSTVTLLRRILRGDEWYSAHRTHAYQHAARLFHSHAKVSAAIGVINLIFVLPAAYICERNDKLAPWITLIVYLALGTAAVAFRAGLPESPQGGPRRAQPGSGNTPGVRRSVNEDRLNSLD